MEEIQEGMNCAYIISLALDLNLGRLFGVGIGVAGRRVCFVIPKDT